MTELGTFVGQLRRGGVAEAVVPLRAAERAADATVASRVRAVLGFYRYQAARGVEVAGRLYETVHARPGNYLPFLEHVARKQGRHSSVVKVRVRVKPVPVLLPGQMASLRESEALWDPVVGAWSGELRYRLLWTLLEETGLRLGEALGLRHRDWKTGTGTTAQVEVVHREDHPHGLRAKSGYRRVFVGSSLDRLYGDWVWALCEAGADVELDDWDDAYIFCNLYRGRLQQKWAREFIAARGAPEGTDPPYLFLQTKNNRLGKRPYASATFHSRLGVLTEELAITDSVGRPVKVSKTHTFRHTRATDLINAGVPIHVVMRYLGHITPTMTMHYAKTLAVTAEREFLRYKKVTADGRTAEVDPSDLYDLLHLDQRADRVLPNGWCMLPPRQVCSKGNACLSCDKFVTDASHREELQHQLQQSEALITRRQTQFTVRHGEPMGEDNIWLAGRLSETRALTKVLVALDQVSVHEDGQLRAVRGAGAADRPELPATTPPQEPTA
ncbi:tyrosine-type recombinase/integrase [Streptomyces sp. NPDC008079]|uniref:tyrosine-type recombinase/integrase n=1 Tax=Streptomyces sp. NPDC008079 TaxID=3364806 RepID=UPI0036E1056F